MKSSAFTKAMKLEAFMVGYNQAIDHKGVVLNNPYKEGEDKARYYFKQGVLHGLNTLKDSSITLQDSNHYIALK